jgi:hypothetical protein
MSATLSDFPIGTLFFYLGRTVVVVNHINASVNGMLGLHYADMHGVIHNLTIGHAAFDYLKSVIDAQRAETQLPPADHHDDF